jgi:hypothetical protein
VSAGDIERHDGRVDGGRGSGWNRLYAGQRHVGGVDQRVARQPEPRRRRTDVPAPWLRVVTDAEMVVAAPAFDGTTSADTSRSAGAFGVADASFELPLSPSPLVADTT